MAASANSISKIKIGEPSGMPEQKHAKVLGLLYAWKAIKKRARKILGNQSDAEDLRQQIAVKVLEDSKHFTKRDPEYWQAYLLVTTRNKAIDQLRETGRENVYKKKFLQEQSSIQSAIPQGVHLSKENESWSEEFCSILRHVVIGVNGKGGFSPEHRSVFLLRYNKNLSYQEIAKIVGVPVGTVKSRLNKCHKRLYEYLQKTKNSFPQSKEGKEKLLEEMQETLRILHDGLTEEGGKLL